MTPTFREIKYRYLFKILDFDHDGIIEEYDLVSIGENISIFRCLEDESEIELFIRNTVKEIWKFINTFLSEHQLTSCNIESWLKLIKALASDKSEKFINRIVENIFHIYDKNHDEFLSKHEYLTLFVSLRVGVKPADFCFRTLDLNNDMRISRAELGQAIEDFFLSDETKSPGNMIFGNPEIFKFSSQDTSPKL
jgi:Ca2+-binding EF-hand superfamily protein